MFIMRFVSVIALLATSTALAGCAGGDGSALSLATSGVTVCGITDPNCATPTTTTGSTGTTTGGTTTNTNTGNTASLATGDATITLENNVITSSKTTPAVSKLTLVAGAPNTAKIEINTNTATNGAWPIAKTMDEYMAGSTAYPNPNGLEGSVLGGTYNEYRSYSRTAGGTAVDEELQVWSFGNSYATQYRDVTTGTAAHQAWSFGGTKTPAAAMTLKGSGHYDGKFGATAKTLNFVDSTDPTQTLSYNNDWSIVGDSSLDANFVTGVFTGTLTPNEWKARATMNGASGFRTVFASNLADPNWIGYMNDNVQLKGTITNSSATGNKIVGTAALDPTTGWLTNSTTNAMYAGVFGPAADEITGTFGLEGSIPGPIGGYYPINSDGRGFITMSGVFNGQ
jgi:hypothetical protein